MIHYFNFYFKGQFQHILGNIPSHLLSSCCLSCNQVALTKTCKYQWISAAAVTQSITSAAQSISFVALPHLTRAGLCWWLAKHCFAAEHMQTPVLTKQHLFAPLKLGPNAPVLAACTAYHGFHFRQYNPDQEQVLALQGQAPRLPHWAWTALVTPAPSLAGAERCLLHRIQQNQHNQESLFNSALWHFRHSKVTAELHLPGTAAAIHPFHVACQAADGTQAP